MWKAGKLRCDQSWRDGDGRSRTCTTSIAATTHGTALRLAAEAGWFRGNRGGRRRDKCPEHHPYPAKT